MRKRLGEIDSHIWIEDVWHPELQRVNDAAIMELFAYLPGAMLRHQLYLRVIMMADLSHESGDFIPDNALTGQWQSGSDLEWPRK